jgi:hypothetical protein
MLAGLYVHRKQLLGHDCGVTGRRTEELLPYVRDIGV